MERRVLIVRIARESAASTGISAFTSAFSPIQDPTMLIAINLALLPVAFVAAMAVRELRPWWRQFRQIRALPEIRVLPEFVRREPGT
jgi:hypothetical protein